MSVPKLLSEHRYAEVIEICTRELEIDPDDRGAFGSRGAALLALRRYDEALPDFLRANELGSAALAGKSQPHLNFIGGILWLLGRHDDAIVTFRRAVYGILDRSIEYGDLAGGVTQGLLLWYAGVTAKDRASTDHALKYLAKLSKTSAARYWPGPVALFALGKTGEDDVLHAIREARSIDHAVDIAKTDLRARRELSQALFYFATRRRVEGDETRCAALMRRCSELEDPLLEIEWYLARGEVDASRS